jgi:hypothetical protein
MSKESARWISASDVVPMFPTLVWKVQLETKLHSPPSRSTRLGDWSGAESKRDSPERRRYPRASQNAEFGDGGGIPVSAGIDQPAAVAPELSAR